MPATLRGCALVALKLVNEFEEACKKRPLLRTDAGGRELKARIKGLAERHGFTYEQVIYEAAEIETKEGEKK